MKKLMKKIERILEAGGIKKDIALLAVSGGFACQYIRPCTFTI